MAKLSAYLSNERSISKRGSNFCAQVELLIIRYIWEETCKSVSSTLKVSILLLLRCGSSTLAHRATVSPPYRSSSEHATGSEDRGGFRVRRQRCGWCCGALRDTQRRRAFGQRRLGQGDIRCQVDLGTKKKIRRQKRTTCLVGKMSVWLQAKQYLF